MAIVKEAAEQVGRHRCEVPNARDHNAGSVWVCDECHRLSIVTNEPDMGKDYNSWRFETEKERRKRWKRGYVYAAELR